MHFDSTLFFFSFPAVLRIRDILVRMRMRTRIRNLWLRNRMWIREVQKFTDPDSEHWYIYIILQRKAVIKKLQNSRNRGFFWPKKI